MTQRADLRIAGIALLFLWALTCREPQSRRSCRYLIPDSYVGWVRIDFEVEGAPLAPIQNDQYVFRFGCDGSIRTSYPIEEGSAHDQYFYYSTAGLTPLQVTGFGRGGMIWQPEVNRERADGKPDAVSQYFFVGTEQQYQMSQHSSELPRSTSPVARRDHATGSSFPCAQ